MSIFDIAIIGVGKVGGALALALSEKGYEVSQLVARSVEKAERVAELIEPRPQIIDSEELELVSADVVFITTQDSEIPVVAKNLIDKIDHLPVIFHMSGSLSSRILQPLCDGGCDVASIHPLVSISNPQLGAKRFKDSYFCIEGDLEAVTIGTQIVEDLEGKPFSIETKYKTLYHASAITACGHLVALISTAVEMLSKCGLTPEESQKVLLPLITGTVQNLSVQTPAEALTGTFARADVDGMQKHLQTLRENTSAETQEIYRILGLRSLPLAAEQGANSEQLEKIKEILTISS